MGISDVKPFRYREVKELRKRLLLTQVEFAEKYGVDVETLRNWEQGKRTPGAMATLFLRMLSVNPETVNALVESVYKKS